MVLSCSLLTSIHFSLKKNLKSFDGKGLSLHEMIMKKNKKEDNKKIFFLKIIFK